MSAPSEGNTSPSPCACTNISLMQLFHELKQKFPGVPDHVVSNTIELYCHDKQACETHLHSEAKASLTHAYHASSSAAARQLNELKVDAPLRCRNQLIIKHEISRPTTVTAINCETPQVATVCTTSDRDDTDTNAENDCQNLVEAKNNAKIFKVKEKETRVSTLSPVTINIDNCVAKYNSESSSDHELTNDSTKEEHTKPALETKTETKPEEKQTESTNYQVLKSNRIKSNLNERLEKPKEKKTICKKNETNSNQPAVTKPERPCTLEFIKPNPDVAFKHNLPDSEPCRTVSPNLSAHKEEVQSNKDVTGGAYWPDRGYPVNLSVKVNCHMDLARGYSDPWLEDFDSPHTITSVNLTVCTPTSSMASPVREDRDGREEDGFEGHVLVTVSPSTTRPPRRRAPAPPQPPPPPQHHSPLEPQQPRPSMEQTREPSLIERQRARLKLLQEAVSAERARLAQLVRETAVLESPLPPPSQSRRLREEVRQLREACSTLAKHFEISTSAPEADNTDFYSNIYTGQRPSTAGRGGGETGAEPRRPARPAPPPPGDGTWQCHVCTFRNHPDLANCEQCEMPRIFVVRASDGITVRLMPGRRKVVHSWVL